MRLLAGFILMALILPAFGQDEVPLPKPRPAAEAAAATEPADDAPVVPLPRERPESAAEETPQADEAPTDSTEPAVPAVEATDQPVSEAPPAEQRPPRVYQTACPALLSGQVEATMLPPIADGACGERSPLSVTGVLVNGRMVPFSGEVTTNCAMAAALPEWAAMIDGYLMARENTHLARIIVGTSYMCRPRNNVSGADVSEHGFANAVDVVGFELEDGRTISLPSGWTDPLSTEGRLLRFAHDAACSRFTTTLGPEANALHHDHLHLDLGCHGSRCTARLCE
jgi:hypothetical protein